jgi:hypothetical protein
MKRRPPPQKRKAPKRKPREIVEEKWDGFEEYANSSPRNLTYEIRYEIEEGGNRGLEDLVNAIHAIDQYGLTKPRPDKKPLIELLRSRSTTPNENLLLADLIDRNILPKGGRPRRPMYIMTVDDKTLSNASYKVEELRNLGWSRADAINRVAADFDNDAVDSLVNLDGLSRRAAVKSVFAGRQLVTESKLADFRAGRRRSRRKKKIK